MEGFRTFLESSTIHGFSYIPTTKKYIRLFSVIVVISGFSGAGYLIYESFQAWEESPVATTIETQSINEITFPRVTVCPPRNTFTDLNYDLMMTENMTLEDNIERELTHYAIELLFNHLYDQIMDKLNMLQEKDRYCNWYNGYSEIRIPYWSASPSTYGENNVVFTSAISGTVYTKYFGEKYNSDRVQNSINYEVQIYPPDSVKHNLNATLLFEIEKNSLKHLSSGSDRFYIASKTFRTLVDVETTNVLKNYTPPGLPRKRFIYLRRRKVTDEDLKKQKLSLMPGFRFSWHYSGVEVEQVAQFFSDDNTKLFVRQVP